MLLAGDQIHVLHRPGERWAHPTAEPSAVGGSAGALLFAALGRFTGFHTHFIQLYLATSFKEG